MIDISFRVSCPVDDGAINKTIVHVAIANSITSIDKYPREKIPAITLYTRKIALKSDFYLHN